MTADIERGLVFLPVSTAGPDLYGGDRPGANLFSDAVVALKAKTGERVWHFQTVQASALGLARCGRSESW